MQKTLLDSWMIYVIETCKWLTYKEGMLNINNVNYRARPISFESLFQEQFNDAKLSNDIDLVR